MAVAARTWCRSVVLRSSRLVVVRRRENTGDSRVCVGTGVTVPPLHLHSFSRLHLHNPSSVRACWVERRSMGRRNGFATMAEATMCGSWRPLLRPGRDGETSTRGVEPAELRLALTLPTGQSFRWRERPSSHEQAHVEFVGVLGESDF